MRYSQQRENIKNGLEEHCIHPSAEELYNYLKPTNPNLSLATVYRNLNQLADMGTIKKIKGLSEQVHYDHNVCEHFHIICVKCRKIMDLPKEAVQNLSDVLNKQKEFKILGYDIIVKGLCTECRAKSEQ